MPEPTGMFPVEIDLQSRSVGSRGFLLDRKAFVAIVLLVAGKASRKGGGGAHKLFAEFDGVPLVRRAAVTALGADAATVVLVTGPCRAEIETALCGLDMQVAENPDYAMGMASPLTCRV